MVSLIDKLKRIYKPLADRKRSSGVYDNGDGNFHILAIDFNGGFIVADDIPSFGMAELIAELLNLTAAVATRGDA
jgi:hypothetical protein